MKYKFYNMGGKLMWSCPHEGNGSPLETVTAIQLLFSNFPSPPPDESIVQVGSTPEGMEQWSVGPFDVLVQKEQ